MMKIKLFRRLTLRGYRWYFRIIASNGEPIAQSEGYHNYRDAHATADSIRRQAAGAKIEDETP